MFLDKNSWNSSHQINFRIKYKSLFDGAKFYVNFLLFKKLVLIIKRLIIIIIVALSINQMSKRVLYKGSLFVKKIYINLNKINTIKSTLKSWKGPVPFSHIVQEWKISLTRFIFNKLKISTGKLETSVKCEMASSRGIICAFPKT